MLQLSSSRRLRSWQIYNAMDVELPSRYVCERQREIDHRKKNCLPMNLNYDTVKALLDPFYCTYECSDGRMFYLVAPCNATHQERTLKALGLWDEMVSRKIPQGRAWLSLHSSPRATACLLSLSSRSCC